MGDDVLYATPQLTKAMQLPGALVARRTALPRWHFRERGRLARAYDISLTDLVTAWNDAVHRLSRPRQPESQVVAEIANMIERAKVWQDLGHPADVFEEVCRMLDTWHPRDLEALIWGFACLLAAERKK